MYKDVHDSTICNGQKRGTIQMVTDSKNRLRYVNTIEYYAAVKINEPQLYKTKWICSQEHNVKLKKIKASCRRILQVYIIPYI